MVSLLLDNARPISARLLRGNRPTMVAWMYLTYLYITQILLQAISIFYSKQLVGKKCEGDDELELPHTYSCCHSWRHIFLERTYTLFNYKLD